MTSQGKSFTLENMKVTLEPILRDCRAIYDLSEVMDRYWTYVRLVNESKGEFLPLGAFSPMGRRQADYLDALIAMNAEGYAARVCQEVCAELESNAVFRVMLVVVDEPRNGWTQRFLTDADWRFSSKTDQLPKMAAPNGFDRWVSVQLWTTEFNGTDRTPTLEYVRQETRAALYRALYRREFGVPETLEAMMSQEGAVMSFSGEKIQLEPDDLEFTRNILEPLSQSRDYPTNFAAMYGDEPAKSVGYAPLGLSSRAGFALALEQKKKASMTPALSS
jgi:hypothetical protein